MKIEIKYLDGKVWKPVEIGNLIGKSIAEYINDSEQPVIAAIYDNGQKMGFVCNRWEDAHYYETKGFSIMASDLIDLLGTRHKSTEAVAAIFPEAGMTQIKLIKEM